KTREPRTQGSEARGFYPNVRTLRAVDRIGRVRQSIAVVVDGVGAVAGFDAWRSRRARLCAGRADRVRLTRADTAGVRRGGLDRADCAAAVAARDVAVVAAFACLLDAVAADRNVTDNAVRQGRQLELEAVFELLAVERQARQRRRLARLAEVRDLQTRTDVDRLRRDAVVDQRELRPRIARRLVATRHAVGQRLDTSFLDELVAYREEIRGSLSDVPLALRLIRESVGVDRGRSTGRGLLVHVTERQGEHCRNIIGRIAARRFGFVLALERAVHRTELPQRVIALAAELGLLLEILEAVAVHSCNRLRLTHHDLIGHDRCIAADVGKGDLHGHGAVCAHAGAVVAVRLQLDKARPVGRLAVAVLRNVD